MIGDLVSSVINGLVSIATSLLMLLPQVDIRTFGIEPNESISGVLSVLNVFIPIKQIVVILGIWAGIILTTNVVFMIKGITNKITKQ